LLSPAVILRTPTDIFPNIDIPVISVAWTYTGLNPEDLETRLTTPFEKGLTTLVDDIGHIESTTYNGTVVVKIYLQPGANVDRANSQVVALSGFILRLLPPATQPPEIINFSASSVSVLPGQRNLIGVCIPFGRDHVHIGNRRSLRAHSQLGFSLRAGFRVS
jgi:multidrug efflux pump subunit AcrB